LVTIDGINFSTDPLDNPVKVGNFWCLVETTSVSQITCRIMETTLGAAEQTELIVFLRTSEEAKTGAVPMQFDYATPISAMVSIERAFDAATNSEVITMEGRTLPEGDPTGISLYLDGVKQETLTVVGVLATFKVTDVKDENIKKVRVYLADGLPANYHEHPTI
jgi:hypothetical protein